MRISEQFSYTSVFFFRWRGYLILLLFPVILLGFVGFRYPFGSHNFDLLWEIGCLLISLLGLCVRVLTVGTAPYGTSGRYTKKRRADVLNTAGMYSIVRHPLYLGNYLIFLGVSFFSRTWYLPIIVSLAFVLHYERVIFSEEEYLENKFGSEFRDWAARVPTIVPRFKNYQSSNLSFSWKVVLRREIYALVGVVGAFWSLDMIGDFIAIGRINFDLFWTPVFVATLVFFLIMRTVKKKTHLLREEGR